MPHSPAPHQSIPSARPTFIHSQRRAARAVQPLVRFMRVESAGGVLLLATTVVAMVWANSPWADSYASLWHTELRLAVGDSTLEMDLGHAVNDVLMAVFFFVVGMEIKRELVVGELRDPRAAALPAFAALGGMVVPAAIYVAFNAGTDGADGWGVPMATDIAFALGVVALLGSRVPPMVKLMLLTLAIVDDIGAIAVIAIFYSDGVDAVWLGLAVLVVMLIVTAHRTQVVYPPVFVALAITLWLTVYQSGVHATIAGVVMGLLTPARPFQSDLEVTEIVDVLERRDELEADEVRAAATLLRGSVPPCDSMISALHPWTSYVIVPVFALANAGLELSTDSLTSPSRVLLGVSVGLVVGKLVGVVALSALAVSLGICRLPDGVRWAHVIGIGALAGIGFTVSLFVTGLAFDEGALADDAKIGTLLGSVIAAVIGSVLFSRLPPSGEIGSDWRADDIRPTRQ